MSFNLLSVKSKNSGNVQISNFERKSGAATPLSLVVQKKEGGDLFAAGGL